MALSLHRQPVYTDFKERNKHLQKMVQEATNNPKLESAIDSILRQKVNSLYVEFLDGTKEPCNLSLLILPFPSSNFTFYRFTQLQTLIIKTNRTRPKNAAKITQ